MTGWAGAQSNPPPEDPNAIKDSGITHSEGLALQFEEMHFTKTAAGVLVGHRNGASYDLNG